MNEIGNKMWKSWLNEARTPKKKQVRRLNERENPAFKADTDTSVERTLKLPKLRISDEWGKPSGESSDRDLIEVFFGALPSGDLDVKINHIENFVKNCQAQVCGDRADSSEILSNLMVLDALSTIIYGFNEKVGGYIFESFVAALLGGKAQAVPATSGEGIQDVITDKGEKVSLKFVTGKKDDQAGVPGSMKNLRASLDGEQYGMPYVVAVKVKADNKDVARIDFYEFDIGTNGKEIINPDGSIQLEAQEPSQPRDGVPLVYAEDYIFPQKNVSRSTDAMVQLAKKGAARFNVTTKDVAKTAKKYSLNLGDRSQMQEVADGYAKQLNDDVISIFSNLDDYVTNINKYLVRQDVGAGTTAITNANQLKRSTQDVQKKVKI